MDPIAFRILNGSHEGTPQRAGQPFKRIGHIEPCEALKASSHYGSELVGPNRGRGVASGFWFNGGFQSSATVNIHTDGSVSVVTGSGDIGGSRAVIAVITAEGLGLDASGVRPLVGDPHSIGPTHAAGWNPVAVAAGLGV